MEASLYIPTWNLNSNFQKIRSRFSQKFSHDLIQGDTNSWKVKLERSLSWQVLIWKVRYEIEKYEVGKLGPKLESTIELGKWPRKLESFKLTWKELIKFESFY